MKEPILRVCVFGGSFHPPHTGHVEAAQRLLSSGEVDRLIVVPAFLPPHKTLARGATAADRLEMARLAFLPLGERVEVSGIELEKGVSRYTLDTLSELKEAMPDVKLCLYVGSDMLFSFETWHEFRQIFPLCRILTLAREGDLARVRAHAQYLTEAYGAEIVVLGDCSPISSSEVRAALSSGEETRRLPEAVLEYIRQNGLYETKGEEE
ncbi:MAG: nicotinate (nicotinamide) nucleotide adenylyltransferase [Clostridia bacterium]|nr:nicotinate (nicotinamide) nucleotide adenylyltransferase [Clostridia bacterium]